MLSIGTFMEGPISKSGWERFRDAATFRNSRANRCPNAAGCAVPSLRLASIRRQTPDAVCNCRARRPGGHGVWFSTVQTCWAGLPNAGPGAGEFTPRVDWLVSKADAVRVAMRVHAFSRVAVRHANCLDCSWRPHEKAPDATVMGVSAHVADTGHDVDFETWESCEMYISASYAPTVTAYAASRGLEADMPSAEAQTQ